MTELASHGVQGGTVSEPLNLGVVEGVVELDVEGLALLGVDTEGDRLANGELGAEQVNLVLRADLVVVGRVGEGQRKHTLLLQVGLVDTGETAGDDSNTAKVTGLQSGVLTRATLTVVPVTDNNPLDAASLVVTSSSRDSTVLASDEVLDLVSLTVLGVDGTDEHVVRNVVKVTTVLQPWASHGDVVGGGLALALDQDREVLLVLAIPSGETTKDLETLASGRDSDIKRLTVRRRGLVGLVTRVVAAARETFTRGSLEEEFLAVLVLEGVSERVELKGTGDGHGNDKVRRGDESVGGRVGVVTASEVTVVGRDDRVGFALLDVSTVPLANARTASVGENDTTEFLQSLQLAITLDGGTDLLRTGGDSEGRLSLDTVVESVTGDSGSARHVFVRGVGARADQTNLELFGPLVGVNSLLELGDRGGKVGGEGTVDVRLELVEVDLDQLVVFSTVILVKLLRVLLGEVTNALTLGGVQVLVHAVVEGEDGSGGTNLSTHVANGTHTSARKRVDTRAVVLNDGTSTTLDSEETSDLENDILGGGPSVQLTSQLDTNDLGCLQLPRKTSHDIDSISTTDTNGSHTETTSVGGVRVGTDHQTTGEGVVLKENLVNDTGARLPETNVVLGGGGGKEIVDLLVDLVGTDKVLLTSNLSLNQVIAVHSGRRGDRWHAGRHELQDGHLSGSILASNTVGAHSKVRLATLNVLTVRVIEVRVQDLLGVGQRAPQTLTDNVKVLGHLPVEVQEYMLANVL